MQNRYVGDVGDFAKYAILRSLAPAARGGLGVIWCLFDDESHNGDGRHITYLQKAESRSVDPELHDKLKRIVVNGRRSVSSVPRYRILPSNTVYFKRSLSEWNNLPPAARLEQRANWLANALIQTRDCKYVFFDPDNGLEIKSVPKASTKAGKYIFWHELMPFWQRGQSLIVYHHLNRTASVVAQIEHLKSVFRERFADAAWLAPLLHRQGSCRTFWIVAQGKDASFLRERVQKLVGSHWQRYLEIA